MRELKSKVIRWAIVLLMFVSIFQIQGIYNAREAQQIIFMLSMILIFGLLVKNLWVTLFVGWTVFLYSFFKFTGGASYLTNVLFGAILYYVVKGSFRKEHIGFFIEGILWFVCLNIFYSVLQVSGYDFIFSHRDYSDGVVVDQINTLTTGLMGHKSIMATLLALSVPLMATRGNTTSLIVAGLLFIPLYFCGTSLCFIMGLVGFMFVLFYKLPKKIWLMLLIIPILFGSFYIKNVDGIGKERYNQWFYSMKHWTMHPVTGWGLGSYANINPMKDFRYMQSVRKKDYNKDMYGNVTRNITFIEWWDNPHNLIISILHEFGLVGMIIFAGFLYQNFINYIKANKHLNTVGLAGFIIVFLGISMGHFPIYLVRMAVIIIPAFALLEVAIE